MKVISFVIKWGRLTTLLSVSILLGQTACGPATTQNSQSKREWTKYDDPNLLSDGMTREYAKLPRSGEAKTIPWTGSYWPYYRDSINDHWNGTNTDSPAKKYEKAFHVDINVEDAVSKAFGVDSVGTKECGDSGQCEHNDTCSKRTGQSKGRCIPTWFGICHAWAPAAIAEPEPQKPVVYNGVEFKINDIKALVSYSYNAGVTAKLVGLRCNETKESIKFDMYGNPTNISCIDNNPGSFHIILTNFLGIKKTSLVENRTYAFEVWNQPLRSYRVATDTEVTADQANQLIGMFGDVISQDKKTGTVAEHAWSPTWSYDVKGADGIAVSMRGSGDADLYVKFDSEPSLHSFNCRSSNEDSNEICNLKVIPGASKVYVKSYGYKGNSDYIVDVRLLKKNSEAYTFNPKATRFRYIVNHVAYVSEADQSTDGNLAAMINRFTNVDTYEYILELDSAGMIIGGEWLNSSRRNHPDFLWATTAKADTTISGIKWSDVKMLLSKATSQSETQKPTTVPYCVANNGRGEGEIFDCTVNNVPLKCAKTDRTYSVMCISQTNNTMVTTNLMDNPGFERDGRRSSVISGWSTWTSTPAVIASYTANDYPHSGTFFGVHSASANYEVYTYQSKSGLSAGNYTLKAWVRSSGGQQFAVMEVKDYGGVKRYANIPAGNAWQQITIDNINVTNGQALVGFYSKASAGQWIGFDDVEFYKN